MAKQSDTLLETVERLITALNAFRVSEVQSLFTVDAVIDDPSTGQKFIGQAGIRDYVERYFAGYRTVTRFLSLDDVGDGRARLRVDFTGDFGHEVGLLVTKIDGTGLISRIDADLE